MPGAAMQKRPGSVTIRDARIIFRNFAGSAREFNDAGNRNFGVVLPPDVAQQMTEDGWNVKYLKPREEGEEPTPWLKVIVSYRNRPPSLVMITQRFDHETKEWTPNRISLPEELAEMLDYADLSKVDLRINPSRWTHSGRTGISAYLQAIYATIQQDELEREYAEIPEIDISGAPLQITAGGEPNDDIIDIDPEDIIEEDDLG